MKLFKSLKKHSFFWLIKLFLKRLIGRELWLKRELDIDTVIFGEWEFSLECLNENGIVYSLGVGDSIEFDLEIIKHSSAFVFAFDPTPYAMKWIDNQVIPKRLKFYPWMISKPVYLRQKKNALILLKINVIKILRFFEKNW